jgi:hypothetical protein
LDEQITWTSPSTAHVILIKQKTGSKQFEAKRYLIMSLKECYAEFTKLNPNDKISFSKFCDLRPKNVYIQRHIPFEVCICRYHSNFRFKLESLCFGNSTSTFLSTVVCDPESIICMLGKCDGCERSLQNIIDSKLPDAPKILQWYEWENAVKIKKTGSTTELLEQLKNDLPAFKYHHFIKRKQAATFQTLRSSATTVLQVDYAENFTIQDQDQIQSAHWLHRQVSIFTAVAWLPDNTIKCFAIISDYMLHDKYSVYCAVKDILLQLHATGDVNIFSDGAASQFKNKYSFCNVSFNFDVPGVICTWHFFSSYHGKGAVDGVGATLKRTIWNAVLKRRISVQSPKDFYDAGIVLCPNITLLYVDKERIEKEIDVLNFRFKKVEKSYPGTIRVHKVVAISPFTIKVFKFSDSCDFEIWNMGVNFNTINCEGDKIVSNSNDSIDDIGTTSEDVNSYGNLTEINNADFVVVQLLQGKANKYFIAQVTESDVDNIMLKYMKSSGYADIYIWPSTEQISTERRDAVIKLLPPPTKLNNRGHFTFGDALKETQIIISG